MTPMRSTQLENEPSRRAFLKALADHALRQFAADEYDGAFALFAVASVALMITFQHHMDALDGIALGVVLERQDAFGAENILTLLSHQILDPGKELVRVERPVGFERQRLHILVVIMLEPAMIMMVAVGMIVVMMFVAVARFQELWLDIENAVEVEGIAVQHLGERRRVGKPRGLDDDGVEFAFAPHQALDDANEIAAHRAADAAVVHLEDFLVGPHDQVIVDPDLAELIDDDGVFLPMRLR